MNTAGRIELLGEEPATDPTLSLVEQPSHAAPAIIPAQQSPMQMMMEATRAGVPLETIERMWALNVKHEEREAQKAYIVAMAAFKKNPPKIIKDKHVHFESQKGTTDYDHATHYGVTSAIIAAISEHGFSHAWVPDQVDGKVGVTCTLTHSKGHSESVRLESAPDVSGGKNSIQAIVSAKTYLERHTLLAITGLSTADQIDDDGRGASIKAEDEAFAIRDQWITNINAAINSAVLSRTWEMAIAEIEPLNRMDVYGAIRNAMAAKKKALEGFAA